MSPSSRRRVLRAIGGGTSVGLVGGLAGCGDSSGACTEPTPEPADALPDEPGRLDVGSAEWPMVYGDAGNTTSVPEVGPTADVVRRWTASPDLGDPGRTWVVADGEHAYVAGRGGSALVALDATDGSVRWRYPSVRDTGPLAVVPGENLVLICDGGGLQAVSAEGGERVWRTNGPALDAADVVLVDDGTAYVASRESILAVDVATGDRLWTTPGTDLGAVAEDRVIAGEGLRALSTEDGRELWASDDPTPYGPVTTAGGEVYVGELGHVTAYDLSDGSRLWRHRGGTGEEFEVPAVADGWIVLGTTRSEAAGGNVYAVDREDGGRDWCGNHGHRDVTVAAGDGVAFLAAGDQLAARRVVDGELVWLHGASDRRYGNLAVAEGALLAAARGGTVDGFGER